MLKKLYKATQGKKTFAVAGATVLFAVLGLFLGKVEPVAGVEMILGALAAAGLRDALK